MSIWQDRKGSRPAHEVNTARRNIIPDHLQNVS